MAGEARRACEAASAELAAARASAERDRSALQQRLDDAHTAQDEQERSAREHDIPCRLTSRPASVNAIHRYT